MDKMKSVSMLRQMVRARKKPSLKD